eukprot:7391638-Prymnesium_polylepis.2
MLPSTVDGGGVPSSRTRPSTLSMSRGGLPGSPLAFGRKCATDQVRHRMEKSAPAHMGSLAHLTSAAATGLMVMSWASPPINGSMRTIAADSRNFSAMLFTSPSRLGPDAMYSM